MPWYLDFAARWPVALTSFRLIWGQLGLQAERFAGAHAGCPLRPCYWVASGSAYSVCSAGDAWESSAVPGQRPYSNSETRWIGVMDSTSKCYGTYWNTGSVVTSLLCLLIHILLEEGQLRFFGKLRRIVK